MSWTVMGTASICFREQEKTILLSMSLFLTCSRNCARNRSSQQVSGHIVVVGGRHDHISIDSNLRNDLLNIVVNLLERWFAWEQLSKS